MIRRNIKYRSTRLPSSSSNGGSMADIAFLLLIFFMVCTIIHNDQGIVVKLPPLKAASKSIHVDAEITLHLN